MIIDLRSDTVTKPTAAMKDAMFSAEVGDDVFGEEPTVNALEKKAALLFSKESALFCPSGTMTNQIAIKVHTQPGEEVLCDSTAHIYYYEGGGIAFNSGVQAKLLQGERGIFSAAQVEENINPLFDWLTKTSLISVENTSNRAGGSIWSMQEMKTVKEVCERHQLKYHLDGARLFNAVVESDYTCKEIGALFDTISICLSKGLGAPVGSLLLGNKELIRKARRIRKVFGGGMRQSGFLAAAGIYALDNHIDRLKEDHSRAKHLGNVLKKLSYIENVVPVQTNIIIFNLNNKLSGSDFVLKLAEKNIKASSFGKNAIRFVTHLDFTDDMMEITESVLKKI